MKNSVIINIHSFLDIITNSSSETFISADKSTVDAIEKLVDCILTAAGSTQKCDDLFEVNLNEDRVVVTTKSGTIESTDAAGILSNLADLFSISSEYNG